MLSTLNAMTRPKLAKLELRVLDALWQKGACSVREIQETFPRSGRRAYTTVQTTVYRLVRKKAVRCVKRISNANIFEAAISRSEAQRRLVDDLLELIPMEDLRGRLEEVQNEATGEQAKGSRLEPIGTAKRTQTGEQNEAKPWITRIARMGARG